MTRSRTFAVASIAALALVAALSASRPIDADPPKPKKPLASPADVAASIDRVVEEEQKKQGLEPSELADDAEFLRRVRLDITGQIPSPDEVRVFLGSNDPEKRAKKVAELLADPLYAEHWSFLWMQRLITGTRPIGLRDGAGGATREWFRDAFASNKPYNQFANELLTASGETSENGAASWLVSFDNETAAAAGSAARVFMGMQIQCAQCHDSKTNDWKQTDFWGFAAFFARARAKRVLDKDTMMPKGFELEESPRGEVAIPETTPLKIVEPKYLAGKVLPRPGGPAVGREFKAPNNPDRKFIGGPADGVDRRKELAKWLTADDNRWFSKAITNYYSHQFIGAGFVEPYDDLDESNPALMPAAMELLAKDFRDGGYDLKRLITTICSTRAYQRSSKPTAANAKDDRYYSHGKLEHLTPDQMFYALMSVTGLENAMARGMDRDRLEDLKYRFLAGFVFLFGNDEGESGDSFNGTIPQALLLMNSPQIQNGLKVSPSSTLGKILQKYETPEARLEEMYLTVLGRFPTDTEKKYFASVIKKYENSKLIYEDIYWALVNSSEFQFNH